MTGKPREWDKLTDTEQDMVLKFLKNNPTPHVGKSYSVSKRSFRFIIATDRHMGNIHYDKKLHDLSVYVSKKESVDAILDAGDIFDGWYQNRQHSIFEQNAIGFDAQLKLGVAELSKYDKPYYFITGNHEYNTFMRGAGVEIGQHLEDKLRDLGKEAYFLGNAEGRIMIGNTSLDLVHPDGGTPYAISYKSQKIAESLEGGKKPNVLIIGNFHKAEYIFYRNIHIFQGGTLESQTKYMKGKPTPAHKGFWLVDLHTKSNGSIDCIVPRFYPSYD